MTEKKPRGRPRKEKTIYAKQPELVNEVVVPVTEPPKAEPSNAEVIPIAESVAEPMTHSVPEIVKIPIKIPKKKGKKNDDLKGKQILTIVDEPVKLSVAEPIKPKKAPKAPRIPKAPKAKPVKQPKVQPKDENLYKMVYQLQQSLQQKVSPRKKTSKYVSSDDDSDTEEEETEEEDDTDTVYHRKIQKRLETVEHIKNRLKQVRQPQPKGKYDHLSIF